MLFSLKIIFGFIVPVNKPKISPVEVDGMIYTEHDARFVATPPVVFHLILEKFPVLLFHDIIHKNKT